MNLPGKQKDIKDFSYEELEDYLKSSSEQSFRAAQIFDWLYKKGAEDFDAMTNLPVALREKLKSDFLTGKPTAVKEEKADDKTVKFLFALADGEEIETVLIPTSERVTLCVSTQVGCKFHCGFCASGLAGFRRNLSCAEILAQILYARNHHPRQSVSHIVFMGIGEPLDNYENLIKAIRIINSPKAVNIAARRITISTCGIVSQIKKLMAERLQIELAISLHGSNNRLRDLLMPVNKKYPVEELIATCREYIQKTKRQITFEYILIRGLTCTTESAEELGKLLKKMTCKMNLIPYNKVEEFGHEPPTKMEILLFKKRLSELGIHATVRMPRGRDVNAACGQL